MGRSHQKAIHQPDDISCGPAALKLAFAMLGKRKALTTLTKLCKTSVRNGTTTKNIIRAVNKLGFSLVLVEYATLHHLQSALKYHPNRTRAVLVSYLYDGDDDDSGHWAVVSSFMASKSRIVLLDSYTGKKKSYPWSSFRERWFDYDLKRRKTARDGHQFHLVRRWQPQLLMVIAREAAHLPKFRISSSRLFPAA